MLSPCLRLSDLGHRDHECRAAERFDDRRLASIKLADALDDRGVFVLRLLRERLYGIGRDLLSGVGREGPARLKFAWYGSAPLREDTCHDGRSKGGDQGVHDTRPL